MVQHDGQGHREADPPAVADLLPDGRAPARHGPGDPTRRGGIQRHERGRVRAPLLRGPLRARVAAHPAHRRAPDRRRGRAGELLAAPGELPSAARSSSPTRSSRRCRRRCSLLDGEFAYAEPLRLALQQITWGRPSPLRAPEQRSVGARDHGLRRRPRAVGAPGEGRDGDLPQQDDHVRLLHDGARRDRFASRRPLPPAVPGWAVLPARPRARAQGDPRVPAVAHPRQGLLRDQGRARFPPPRGLRPARLRAPRGVAARRPGGPRGSAASPRGSPGRSNVTSVVTARSGHGRGGGRRGRSGACRAPGGSPHERDDVVFTTGYSSPRTIVSWVLGLGEHARLLGPESLTRRAGPAPGAVVGAPRRGILTTPRRRSRRREGPRIVLVRRGRRRKALGQRARARGHRDQARAVRAAGDAREHPDPCRARRRARIDRGRVRAAADQRGGAARGRQRAERRQLRRRLLRAVCGDSRNRGRGRHDRGRPRALQRQLRPARAPAARRGARRWSRRST